jgi:hypothetical protein
MESGKIPAILAFAALVTVLFVQIAFAFVVFLLFPAHALFQRFRRPVVGLRE